jgi:two-component system sensor kinase FixL
MSGLVHGFAEAPTRDCTEQDLAGLQAAFAASPLAMAVLDADGTWTHLNHRFSNMVQPVCSPLAGDSLDSLPPALATAAGMLHRQIMRTGQTAENAQVFAPALMAAGTDISECWQPLRDTAGRVFGVSIALADETARRQQERSRTASETRLRQFIDHAPSAIALFDTHMRYLAVNRRYLADYHAETGGAAPDALLGRCLYDLFPNLPEAWRAAHRRVLAGESLDLEDEPFTRPDGHTEWVRWSMTPLRGSSDDIIGAILFSEFTTARKTAEARFHQLFEAACEEERQRRYLAEQRSAILDVLPAHIALLDAAGIVIAVNSGWCEFGQSRGADVESHVGADYLAVCATSAGLGDAIAAQVLEGLRGLLAGTRSRLEMDYPCHSADEPEVWSRLIAVPLVQEGKPAGAVVMHMDITAQMRAQHALEEREARLASILDTMPDALVIIDDQGRIESFSAAAERMFGWTAGEAVGRDVSELMSSADAVQHGFYISRYKATGQRRMIGSARVVSGRRRNGSIFPMELALGEIRAGCRRLFTGFARDLTELRATQARLQELQSESMHVSRLREAGAMVSALAHELNQPLTSAGTALGAARRLLGEAPEEDRGMLRDAIGLAADQVGRAGRIVQNLRDFVTRGEVDRRLASVSKLVETASALALAGTGGSRIHVSFAIDPELPYVFVDRVQIQQVLVNLMRNAVQAMAPETESGEILAEETARRELQVRAVETAHAEVEIAVSDTGPGIAPEMAANLFQPFMTTKPCGMGVGLSICRSIIEVHGGKIWAEPNPGGGTVFRITLPTVTAG